MSIGIFISLSQTRCPIRYWNPCSEDFRTQKATILSSILPGIPSRVLLSFLPSWTLPCVFLEIHTGVPLRIPSEIFTGILLGVFPGMSTRILLGFSWISPGMPLECLFFWNSISDSSSDFLKTDPGNPCKDPAEIHLVFPNYSPDSS